MLFELNLKTIVLKFFSPAAIIMCVWREGEKETDRQTDFSIARSWDKSFPFDDLHTRKQIQVLKFSLLIDVH